MVKSMTGFGRGEARDNGRMLLVEIKSVNHRYCDIFVKIPRYISFLEDRVRNKVAATLSRGKIDVYIDFDDYNGECNSIMMDEGLAKAYIKALEAMRDKFGLKDDISVSLVSRFPDVLKLQKIETDGEKIWSILERALDEALASVVKMREDEGEKLREGIMGVMFNMENIIKDISLRAPNVVNDYKKKLEARIKELLGQETVDESRLAMEAAIFADRSSIDEEMVRLCSHIGQLKETLGMDQPIGRKLDFLIQEMNREVNTIGSKANDLFITKSVLELKSEIEKIREQAQNIE